MAKEARPATDSSSGGMDTAVFDTDVFDNSTGGYTKQALPSVIS